jgi:hypothetical protein
MSCWKALRVCGTKFALNYFLIRHGVDILLYNATHLRPEETFRLANICHSTDRITGGKAIPFRCGVGIYTAPDLVLNHLEAIAIHLCWPADWWICWRSTRFPDPSSMQTCLSFRWASLTNGGRPESKVHGLELKADHFKWQEPSWIPNEHSCLIYGLDAPTIIPYNFWYPRFLNTILTDDLVTSVHLAAYSALIWNRLYWSTQDVVLPLSTYQTARSQSDRLG